MTTIYRFNVKTVFVALCLTAALMASPTYAGPFSSIGDSTSNYTKKTKPKKAFAKKKIKNKTVNIKEKAKTKKASAKKKIKETKKQITNKTEKLNPLRRARLIANDVREIWPLFAHWTRVSLTPGNVVPPNENREQWNALDADLAPELLDKISSYANNTLRTDDGSWKPYDQSHASKGVVRYMLAKLIMAERLVTIDGQSFNAPEVSTLIDDVNNYLLEAALEPWALNGSSVNSIPFFEVQGDYDFTEVTLIPLLYLYGNKPDFLKAETKDHILNTLIISDGRSNIPDRFTAPNTFGLITESENHILKIESNRYLKNQWLRDIEGNNKRKYNNDENGVEAFILDYLDHTLTATIHEFNSLPYGESSLIALMNLASFANEPVAGEAKKVLNAISFRTALSSLNTRRSVPIRRKLSSTLKSRLYKDDDYTAMVASHLIARENAVGSSNPIAYDGDHNPLQHRSGTVLYSTILSYRTPNATLDLLHKKETSHFIALGNGYKSSPQLHSAGPGYMISAGGVVPDAYDQYSFCSLLWDDQKSCSDAVSRSTSLILTGLPLAGRQQTFRMSGSNTVDVETGTIGQFWKYNNTCVYENFACSAARVWIPEQSDLDANNITRACEYDVMPNNTTNNNLNQWCVYSVPESADADAVHVAVYSSNSLGIMAIFPDANNELNAADLLADVINTNSNASTLEESFSWPEGGTIYYDRHAPRNKWAITHVDYNARVAELGRDYELWSRINLVSGSLPDEIEVNDNEMSSTANTQDLPNKRDVIEYILRRLRHIL